jgi:hypothetical protein
VASGTQLLHFASKLQPNTQKVELVESLSSYLVSTTYVRVREIQSLGIIKNDPGCKRRSLKLQKELYYTNYPLLISIVYANSSPDAPAVLWIENGKENHGYLSKLKR